MNLKGWKIHDILKSGILSGNSLRPIGIDAPTTQKYFEMSEKSKWVYI
jgi:hypothetical protein